VHTNEYYNNDNLNLNYSLPNTENSNDTRANKIRILVDIDKNPDLLRNFFTRLSKIHNDNKSDSQDYKIIVNLHDFFDAQEEDKISRKLIDIAENRLHKNVTNNQKMPKTLWVFPIYEDEENDSLITELENKKQHHFNLVENENHTTTYKFEDSDYAKNYLPTKNSYEVIKVGLLDFTIYHYHEIIINYRNEHFNPITND
jgi:hypothetical protein